MRYRITTLGCRVNHAEARELEGVLRARGLSPAGRNDPADLEVVHSCSVTNSAAAKSRQAVRRARRRTKGGDDRPTGFDGGEGPSKVIITGCYAGTHEAEAGGLVGEAGVVPQTGPAHDASTIVERFARTVDNWLAEQGRAGALALGGGPCPADVAHVEDGSRPSAFDDVEAPRTSILPLPIAELPDEPARHVRAEIRIQDGCDAHCTFCIIPSVRRTLRSKTPDVVRAEAERLVDLGHREVVLAGIFMGAYGHETALRRKQSSPEAERLAELLDAVARVPGLERVRLSSLEPGDVTEALLDAMVANQPTVVPHLHLPLQSGSDRILRRMNRQYDIASYMEMIDQVNAALTTDDGLPPAITTDVICGFPGETGEDFEATVETAKRIGYLHMHVFPFSPKEGTAAARWRRQFVPEPVKKARVRRLIDMEMDPEDGLGIRYRRRLISRRVRVMLEQPDRNEPGWMAGRCDHYALVHVRTDLPRGRLVEAAITEVAPERTVGEVVDAAVALPVLG